MNNAKLKQLLSEIRACKQQLERMEADEFFKTQTAPLKKELAELIATYQQQTKRDPLVLLARQDEKRRRNFLANWSQLKELRFSVGGYPGDYATGLAVILPKKVVLLQQPHSLIEGTPCLVNQLEREQFLTAVQACHLEDWQREYFNLQILDGTQWSLTCYYQGRKQTFTAEGSNDYPASYERVKNLLLAKDEAAKEVALNLMDQEAVTDFLTTF